MNNDFYSRTKLLIGEDGIQKLQKVKIAIFGIGGVGSFVAEGLIRAGIQNFILIDNDTISESNINRQIHSTKKTIGKYKVDVMKQRMLEINPSANIETHKEFYIPNNRGILNNTIDYIVDCIDTITSKIDLVLQAENLNIPIISAMGTGNKLDPTKFEVADIYKTSVCPLAKVMRKELKARGIKKLKVVYSKEEPIKAHTSDGKNIIGKNGKIVPGSISFCPSVAGLIIAGEVVKDLINK